MFKKFHPKEDVASSTSMKSSIQRQHRAKLLSQLPYLSLPAVAPLKISHRDEEEEEEDHSQRKKDKKGGGGGGGGGKGGKGGKGKKGREEQVEEVVVKEEEEVGEEVLTVLDVIWPKKEQLTFVKCREAISILVLHGEPLFFQHFEGPYYPTLRLLHRYPGMLPRVGVDRGAIKFVLGGAHIMCPGLTSPTAYLPPTTSNIPKGTPVAVHAYGKEEALAVGFTAMSTDDIRTINKNCGVENVTFLGDDLWKLERL